MITPELRSAIRSAEGSVRQIAKRFEVNPKTVVKWRACADIDLGNMLPTRQQCILGEVDEWRLVRFRVGTALSLDDCLYASQSTYPWLSRSTLYRCFRRFGISKLSDLAIHQYLTGLSPQNRLGVCSFYITRVSTDVGQCDIYVISDHATKLTLMRVYRPDDTRALSDFRAWLQHCFPFPIRTVLLIEDTSSANHQSQVIERVSRAGTKIEVLNQPLLIRNQNPLDSERPGADTRALASFVETQNTIGSFLLRFNFERKIQQIGGLRPAEAVHKYCGKLPSTLRDECFSRLATSSSF